MKLIWKTLKGFSRYKISNMGQVYSKQSGRWKERFPYIKAGYRHIDLISDTGATKHFKLHRILYELFVGAIPEGSVIDHMDGDGLNNSIDNLRVATSSQNSMNMKSQKDCVSKYKGVRWDGRRNHWYSKIKKDGSTVYLGSYATEVEAARAYNEAALKMFGEYARLNILEEEIH